MITVQVKENKQVIEEIVFSGHALFAEYGQDIVCASATTAAIVTANAIEGLYGPSAILSEAEEGKIRLFIKDTMNQTIQTLLRNLIASIEDLEEQYSNHIKILK